MTNTKVVIYSDGGADPNPGIGGWAAVLRYGEHEKVLTGHDPQTTNNRMELQAALAALQALKRPAEIEFHTDTEYLRQGITEWSEKWEAKGWQKAGKPTPNADLWQLLLPLVKQHTKVKCGNGAAAGSPEVLTYTPVAGTTYYVRVFSYGIGSSFSGDFSICEHSLVCCQLHQPVLQEAGAFVNLQLLRLHLMQQDKIL